MLIYFYFNTVTFTMFQGSFKNKILISEVTNYKSVSIYQFGKFNCIWHYEQYNTCGTYYVTLWHSGNNMYRSSLLAWILALSLIMQCNIGKRTLYMIMWSTSLSRLQQRAHSKKPVWTITIIRVTYEFPSKYWLPFRSILKNIMFLHRWEDFS